jgi:hypothetical protein
MEVHLRPIKKEKDREEKNMEREHEEGRLTDVSILAAWSKAQREYIRQHQQMQSNRDSGKVAPEGETDGLKEETTEGFKYIIAATISRCKPLKSIKRIAEDVGTAGITIQ